MKLMPEVTPCKGYVGLSSTSETRSSVQVIKLYICQTANSPIVQFTSTLLFDLFSAGSTEDCIIFLSNILEQKLFF